MAEEAEATLTRLARDFVEVTSVSDPVGQKRLQHVLTGKILVISARWEEENDGSQK